MIIIIIFFFFCLSKDGKIRESGFIEITPFIYILTI